MDSDNKAEASFTVPGLQLGDGHKVAALLQERLHALNDLQLTLKHAHWNVVGPDFIGVHEMLDPQIDLVRGYVDALAERMATLGVAPVGTPGALVRNRSHDDYSVGRASTQDHLAALNDLYSAEIESHRQAVRDVGPLDSVTEDILIGQTAEFEQFQWFIRAHLENASGRLPHLTDDSRSTTLNSVGSHQARSDDQLDRQERILEAVLTLLARHGISGVSMRAVAKEAGVALGLVNYYFEDKSQLIASALRRVEEQDIRIVEPDRALAPDDQLRAALRRVADPEFLTTQYLSLRLQLWALAQVDEAFAIINAQGQQRYRAGLAVLIRNARPALSRAECDKRAADIDVLQNGLWLTALLGLDITSIRRNLARTEEIALGSD